MRRYYYRLPSFTGPRPERHIKFSYFYGRHHRHQRYMDDTDLPTQIKELFDSFDPEDEVVMMTDMLGGSVNQQVLPICKRSSSPDLRY